MKKQSLKSLIVALLEYQLVICIVICPQTGTFGDYCPQVGTLGTRGLTFSIFFGQKKNLNQGVIASFERWWHWRLGEHER
jgi:hypothetical protein